MGLPRCPQILPGWPIALPNFAEFRKCPKVLDCLAVGQHLHTQRLVKTQFEGKFVNGIVYFLDLLRVCSFISLLFKLMIN